ncbi:MAG: MFS transporter [Desulfarculaceae bacterium]|nr:MFS transporter [Desulfarculaceae bacterium]MCF8072458.1 MFS transporter [Desulfarculaceae bacterium]MCF8102919.1 MFS transporter [Desulfarculaceae bacterium]MCF8117478.1 MFS transporter [Desulfarculaceae bacterium]
MSEAKQDLLAQAKRYRYLICLVIFLSYLLVYFHRLCPAVIALDIQADFGMSGTVLGLLGSAYFYPYALMQIPVGVLADSWGPRKTIFAFFLVAAAGSVLMGLAPSLGWAVLGRVMVGAGVATVFVCNFKLLSQWFCAERFLTMGGVFMAVGGVGALTAGAPLALLSDALGWRLSLAAVGGFTAIMAALVWLVVRDKPQDKGWPAVNPEAQDPPPVKAPLLAGIKQVVTSKRFWPLSLWAFFATGLSFAMGGLWGGPYLMQVHGLSKAMAGGVLSTFSLSLLIGSPAMGVMANRWGRKPILMAASALLCVCFGLLYLFTASMPLWFIYVVFFCLGVGGAATGPVMATVSKELFPVEIAGTSVGMVNLFPFLGGALFQVAMGAVLSWGGEGAAGAPETAYQAMFLFTLAGALAALGISFLLTETKPRARSL